MVGKERIKRLKLGFADFFCVVQYVSVKFWTNTYLYMVFNDFQLQYCHNHGPCNKFLSLWFSVSVTMALKKGLVRYRHWPHRFASLIFPLSSLHITLSPSSPSCSFGKSLGINCTSNEGLVRIQHKFLVPIYVFPEMKLLGLVISKTDLF